MVCLRTVAVVGLTLLASAHAAETDKNAAAAALEVKVTPLQKLISMLDGLNGKCKQEKHEEKVEFTKFHVWCDEVRESKTKSIAEGAAQIESLTADILKAQADAAGLAEEITALEAAIAKNKEEEESATAMRKQENADYSATHKDLSESVSACERAVQTLKAKSADVPQALLQVQHLARTPGHAKAALSSFLALHTGSEMESGAPEANSYEFQSGSIVSIIEKLTSKFKEQRYALEKAEKSAKNNYEQLMQQLADDIKADTESSASKTQLRATRLEDAASAKADLETTKATKADDEKALSETNTECLSRSEEFEKNQVTRGDEVKALSKAIEILSSGAVKGAADEHLPAALLQASRSSARALVQLPGGTADEAAVRRQAVALLQGKAHQLGSRYLLLAAARAAADPFGKVRKMIKSLILKLQEEETAEAEQHAYCTSEMDVNKHTRETKESQVEELTALADQLTAESTRLSTEMKELSDAIADIRSEQSEARQNREAEKKSNEKTIAEAKEAQTAVEAATKVLRDYYSKAADASLLQGTLRQQMSAVEKAPYKGAQSSSTGIFGMLEVVLSDFARLEAETTTAEEEAASAHAQFMTDSDGNIEVKEFDIERKESKKQLTEERLRSTKKELGLTQEELSKATDYHDKLKAECVDSGLSYEDRKVARDQEIQAMQETLEILQQNKVY